MKTTIKYEQKHHPDLNDIVNQVIEFRISRGFIVEHRVKLTKRWKPLNVHTYTARRYYDNRKRLNRIRYINKLDRNSVFDIVIESE